MKKPVKIIIIVSVIVVIIGVSAAAAVLLNQYQSSVQTPSDTTPATRQRTPAQQEADAAEELAFEGDVAAGTKKLDAAIENASDSHDKFVYYSAKATLLLNNGDATGALDPAMKAFELEESSGSAAFVGQIARSTGNTALAIEYYKKAIELIDPTSPIGKNDRVLYQSFITEMGS